jgi:integrase
MSVYAKKNAKGEPTGQWVIEVVRDGTRYRKYSHDFKEAKAIELSLALGTPQGLVQPHQAHQGGYLVRDLKKDARVIWRNHKDVSQSLQRFDACMDLLGLDKPVASIRTSQLDQLVEDLRAKSLGDTTVHRYLCTVSAALKWAVERDHIAGKPVFPWKSLKKGEPRQDTISPEDDARIMEWLSGRGSPDISVVMDLLLTTGMRIGELTKLKPSDFNLEEGSVTIGNWEGRTKNGDKRVVPLQESLAARAVALATVGWPTYRRINSALHRARKALGITHRVTPHVMRHTVITRLNKAKVPIATIMDLVGHRSMATTKGYTHPDLETLAEATGALTRGDK